MAVVPFAESRAAQHSWDAEHDIVVVGSGNAAFAAAITARVQGADVAIFEKGTYVGGTSVVSGGGAWFPNNHLMQADGIEDPRDDAIAYMARYSQPHKYNPNDPQFGLSDDDYALFSAYYDGSSEVTKFLEDAEAIAWTYREGYGPNYDQVQIDYMDTYEENKAPSHRALQPLTPEGGQGRGGEMIGGYQAWSEANGVEIHLNHRVEGVVTNTSGEVIGVEITVTDPSAATATPEAVPTTQTLAIRARKGVIFASGGFSRNQDMMDRLMPAPYYGGCSAPTNEGDFLRISAGLGAKLGNLHNVWRNEALFEPWVESALTYNCTFYYGGDSFLIVNKKGKRFVNEKRNYQDRPMAHQDWDENYGDWESRLSFFVYDQRMQDNWGARYPLPEDPTTAPYMIIGDTLEELADAINERVESLRESSGNVTLDTTFKETFLAEVEKFNGYARDGVDPDFERGSFDYDVHMLGGPYGQNINIDYPSADQANVAMYPLSEEGPYYAFILVQSSMDTNGGPVINPNAQIVRWDGAPIEGLYGAGNCIAHPGGNAYWGAGATLGSGHVWGYLAAKHAVASGEKSAD